jgi:hypothetical protein
MAYRKVNRCKYRQGRKGLVGLPHDGCGREKLRKKRNNLAMAIYKGGDFWYNAILEYCIRKENKICCFIIH